MVDNTLRWIENNLSENNLHELELPWSDLRAKAEPLYRDNLEEWAKSLKADGEKLESAIATRDFVNSKKHFRYYRRQASLRFQEVDTNLKNLCDDLRKVGEPLNAVLRMMQ